MNELRELLGEAKHEIEHLRRTNEILDAKVSVMELFELVLHTKPAVKNIGMSEDIAWKMQKFINKIDDEELIKVKDKSNG